MSATYGGVFLFGTNPKMKTVNEPRSIQKNEFFGLDGVETLDGGGRGFKTIATGWFIASDAPTYRSLWSTAHSYVDNIARVVVDTSGESWASVRLVRVSPTTVLHRTASGGYMRGYEMEFEHNI